MRTVRLFIRIIFIVGSLAALLCAWLGLNIWIQVGVFLVVSGTPPRPLKTLETVFRDNPQASAMSCIVTLFSAINTPSAWEYNFYYHNMREKEKQGLQNVNFERFCQHL